MDRDGANCRPRDGIMKLLRRRFLHLAAGAAALPAMTRIARAQTYPFRPVRIVAGSPPGGGIDIVARLIGQWLSERLGQPFVIEDRPGAATNIATESVVRARADGYTLLLAFTTNAINATLYDKLNFNFISDVAPVASIARGIIILVVNPSFPARTVPDLIAYAKANPGKVNMASGNNGGPAHVAGELLKVMAGVDMLHVPYRGDPPALTDVLGGRVQLCLVGLPASVELIRAGKLHPLAVTTAIRAQALPDLPTVGEFLPGYEASVWFGIGAPRNTPVEIVDKLNREINAALVDPKIKARLADLGGTVLPGSPADFGTLIVQETEKWAKVVKFAGIKPD
jgi:tripartite-type tricarboxylate transporter receptor subunit TctC